MNPRRWSTLAAGTSFTLAAMSGMSAASADEGAATTPDGPVTEDPWVSITPEGYYRFALPHGSAPTMSRTAPCGSAKR